MKQATQSVTFGLIAIGCWASFATFGNFLLHLPPFYVLAIAFILGSLPALIRPRQMFPGWKITCWGILGFFSYHFFLFYSFRYAPAIEANLINYLWPMILVLLTPLFFEHQKLKFYHVIGMVLAIMGCAVLVWGKGVSPSLENIKGYLLALGAAVSWPIYSIVKKKMGTVSVWSVGGFCLGAGLLCFITHLLIEPWVVLQWHDARYILLLGLFPLGLAFYSWDRALNLGDTRVIGALSYLTPVLSTLGLVLFTGQTLTWTAGIAMILIIGGASTGLLDFLPSKNLVK